MIRKLVLGASAVALAVGGLAIVASPATAAKPKINGSVTCTNTNASATFTPALKIEPTKKILLAFGSTQSGCTVANPEAGAEAITNIAITGSGKLKQASATGLLGVPGSAPTVIKVTLEFKNAGGVVLCKNKAKLATGPTTFSGPGNQTINFSAASNLLGGKNLGGKCFKGKPVLTGGALGQTVNQMGDAVAAGGITAITIPVGTLTIP
jgi:hypothetical protein